MSRPAVFVDLDRTLLRCESFRVFLIRQCLAARSADTARMLWAYRHRLSGRIDGPTFKERSLVILRGMHRADVETLGARFSEQSLSTRIRAGALARIGRLATSGAPVFIATASPRFYVEPLSARCGFAGCVATELEYDDQDRLTGRFAGGDCLGAEKAVRVRRLAAAHGIDLQRSVFCTDSIEDLPSMELVGRPIAVCPDRELKSMSDSRRWPVEYW